MLPDSDISFLLEDIEVELAEINRLESLLSAADKRSECYARDLVLAYISMLCFAAALRKWKQRNSSLHHFTVSGDDIFLICVAGSCMTVLEKYLSRNID